MFRRIREPFGKAGLIVAVVALVAALVGGAYAATGLNGKQKKEVKKIAKQFAGKDGAMGPAGAQGPKGDTGAAGVNGTNGTNGKDGKNGESVNVIPLTAGNGTGKCEDGGTKFVNGTGEAFACNGTGGTGGGYPQTLPSGDSMTGYWEVLGESALHVSFVPGEEWALTTISFPLPLAAAPTETVLIPAAGGTEEQQDKCPGNPEDPEATAGVLCLYQTLGEPVTLQFGGATTFGAGLFFAETDEGLGSWAVKAP
jgi:hypothetical protein